MSKLKSEFSVMAVAVDDKMHSILVTDHDLAIKIGQLLKNDGAQYVNLATTNERQEVWFYPVEVFP